MKKSSLSLPLIVAIIILFSIGAYSILSPIILTTTTTTIRGGGPGPTTSTTTATTTTTTTTIPGRTLIKGIHVQGGYNSSEQSTLIQLVADTNATHAFATTVGWEIDGYSFDEVKNWTGLLKGLGMELIIGSHATTWDDMPEIYETYMILNQTEWFEPDAIMLPEIPFPPGKNPYNDTVGEEYISFYNDTYHMIKSEYPDMTIWADLGMWKWNNFIGDTLEINETNLAQYAPWKAYLAMKDKIDYCCWDLYGLPLETLGVQRMLKYFERANEEPHTCEFCVFEWGGSRFAHSDENISIFLEEAWEDIKAKDYMVGANLWHLYHPKLGEALNQTPYGFQVIDDPVWTGGVPSYELLPQYYAFQGLE